MYQYLDHPKRQICPGCGNILDGRGISVRVTRYGQRSRRFVHNADCLRQAREMMDVVVEVEGAEAAAWQMQSQFA